MAMDVEAEIRDLKRRVGELEGSFGFLTQQVKGVHRDLLAFQQATEQRFDRLEQRLDTVEQRLERKIDAVDLKVDRLARQLPTDIAEVMREVLRERDGKSNPP
jgi:predicted RNase H-like nuclease (RuvC/YqgF family)